MAEKLPPPVLSDAPLPPGLYVVATPIGNLRDITLRALDVLARVDVVLAEDTRVTGKLLAAFGVSAKLERYDDLQFFVMKTIGYVERGGEGAEVVETGEVMIFCGPDFVVTVRHGQHGSLGNVRRQLEADPKRLALGPAGPPAPHRYMQVRDYRSRRGRLHSCGGFQHPSSAAGGRGR